MAINFNHQHINELKPLNKIKPKIKNKAPDRTGLKKAIADVRASDKRLYDAGVGKKPSLVQQRKYTKENGRGDKYLYSKTYLYSHSTRRLEQL